MLLCSALNAHAKDVARGNAAEDPDICTWKAIDCTDGLANSICIQDHGQYDLSVEMEWLPPTLEFIHLESIRVYQELSLTTLPRALKYMCLSYCIGLTPCIDCANLPRKMEELILIDSVHSRKIFLCDMPQTMRYVYICQMPMYIHSIVVNYNSLPVSLHEMRVTYMNGHQKLQEKVTAIGKPQTVKLQTNYDRRHPILGSKYIKMFDFQW